MFIEEVILDGFKSYSAKISVGPFDNQFNAITGLNGTGKSNILDAICFVLGITNLAQVRVDSLTQLVYKNGQAGVTKASVTVIFNNQDRRCTMHGLDKCDKISICRQIVIGGRNRYMLNGNNVQANQIANLFQSVQLNVNNPHFLIMQGRITKVINMKPQETLSMIEEAAGTRMYETKKINAKKQMDRKEGQLAEINRVLNEELEPMLAKLQEERKDYMQWASNQAEIDRLTRFCVAGDYLKWTELQGSRLLEQEEMDATFRALTEEHESLLKKHEEVVKAIKDSEQLLDESKVKEVEEKHTAVAKARAGTEAKVKNMKKRVQSELDTRTKGEEQLVAIEASTAEKQKLLEEARTLMEEKEKSVTVGTEEVEKTQRAIAAVQAGMVEMDEGAAKSLKETLMERKSELMTFTQEKEKRKARSAAAKKNIEQAEGELKSCNKEGERLAVESQKGKAELEKLREELAAIKFDEEEYTRLVEAKRSKRAEIENLHEELGIVERQLHNVDFQYDDPHEGFDRSRVKGKAVTLFTIKDSWEHYGQALEVVAGGKMFHVIVDNEETGKLLIEDGNLKRRVTVIPLNKMVDPSVKDNVWRTAKRVASKAEVFTAIEIVDYASELAAAMKFIFGGTFMCEDEDTAKKIAFHPDIKTKCVTKLGDVYDPQGTLTGGSSARQHSILELISQFTKNKKDYADKRKELESIQETIKDMDSKWYHWRDVNKKYEYKKTELSLLEERARASEYGRLAEEVAKMKKDYEVDVDFIKNAPQLQKEAQKRVDDLEKEITEAERTKDKKTADLRQKMEVQKKELKEMQKEAKAQKEIIDTLEIELDNLTKDVAEFKQNNEAKGAKFDTLKKELEDLEETLTKQVTELGELAAEKDGMREKMRDMHKLIQEKGKEKDQLKRDGDTCECELKKLTHKIGRFNKDLSENGAQIEELEKRYPWVLEEKENFGKPDTDFDFEKNNLGKAKKKLVDLKVVTQKLERVVNKKVMNQYDKTRDDLADLVQKRDKVLKDKEGILSMMADLDQKKKEAVVKTWATVNEFFGSIFSILLPGASAKLDPPDGMRTATEIRGLEIKVSFSGTWKDTLSELSGGQRSLLSLALILALLRYKPAPMYILDEVDAALDLSHTQNIGAMIKEHFPDSQFIVVSLKKGMFDNANVLFTTQFVDGSSKVTRTVTTNKNRKDPKIPPKIPPKDPKIPPKDNPKKRVYIEEDDEMVEEIECDARPAGWKSPENENEGNREVASAG